MDRQKPGHTKHSLLWLWITLGIVGTVAAVFVVLFAAGVFNGPQNHKPTASLPPVEPEHQSRYQDHSQAPYQQPTEESITAFESLLLDLNHQTAGLIGSDGYVQEENKDAVLRIAGDYVRDQYRKGILSEYAIEEDSVFLRDARTGITYVLTVPIEGVDAAGPDTEITICTFQPFRSDYDKRNDAETNRLMSFPDEAAVDVDVAFDNYSFSPENDLDNQQVRFDVFRQFGRNQLILWHGHGDYTRALGPFIGTSTESSIPFKFDHWDDYINNRITNGGRFGGDLARLHVCVTSKYIDTYCPDLTGSLVYMGICESGRTDQLANAFLNKGAVAYIGNSRTIYTTYNLRMQNSIIHTMTRINPNTGDYYTLEEARLWACGTYGKNDGSKRHATPLIFGDKDYRLRSVAAERELGHDADQRMVITDQECYAGPWQETYLTILRKYADGIRGYQRQQELYLEYLDGDPLYVAMPDMNGDYIPELMFFWQPDRREETYDADLELEADLYVYRSNGNETRCVVSIRNAYLEASNGADYTVAFCSRDQTFHVEYYVGNGVWQRTFSIPDFLEQVYMRAVYGDPEDYNPVDHHFLNGKYISKPHFVKEWLKLSEYPYKVIGSLDYKSAIPDKLYTVDEAIRYLEGLVSQEQK